MRAPRRPAHRGTVRGPHPMLAATVALALAVLASIAGPPVANADPPPTWSGPWLEVNPDHGRVDDPFTAAYWYVTERCPFDLVSWAWDGKDRGTSKLDPTTCSFKAAFDGAPTPEVGSHIISAVACQVDPSDGSAICDDKTIARVTYTVDPTPTLRVKPTEGLATEGFSATYAANTRRLRLHGRAVHLGWDRDRSAGPPRHVHVQRDARPAGGADARHAGRAHA